MRFGVVDEASAGSDVCSFHSDIGQSLVLDEVIGALISVPPVLVYGSGAGIIEGIRRLVLLRTLRTLATDGQTFAHLKVATGENGQVRKQSQAQIDFLLFPRNS